MSKKLLGLDLALLIEQETKKAVENILDKEKIKQQQQADAQKPFKARKKSSKSIDKDDSEEVDEGGENEQSGSLKTPAKVKQSKLPEITLDKIVNLLNSLRSGRSLKDNQAKKDLKAYFTRLNGSERVALFAFLTGLDKIMAANDGDQVGDDASTPSKDPYKISMKKDAPKVSKKPAAGSDSPIVVGESANKSREKKIIRSNR
ncbi:MAG: hypothetical protein CBC29_07075 [Methylococcaceae bacterium TMED69]|nr:MAG: hypothetical protein CBC29_07075 [Methylococcaceae bacterium TMED69]